MIKLKRAYDEPEAHDGVRVLVDRVWPRGIRKDKLKADLWLKEAAPSSDLRKWFGHDPAKWLEFKKRYKEELEGNEAFEQLKQISREEEVVTLLFDAADTKHNQAVALKHFLTG
jgi:uncharacterized protein YeaO (DUF488 family)